MSALYPSRTSQSDSMKPVNTASLQKLTPIAPVASSVPLFPQFGTDRNKIPYPSSLSQNPLFPYDHFHYTRAQSQIYPYALIPPPSPLLSPYVMGSPMSMSSQSSVSSMGLMSPFFGFPVEEIPRGKHIVINHLDTHRFLSSKEEKEGYCFWLCHTGDRCHGETSGLLSTTRRSWNMLTNSFSGI